VKLLGAREQGFFGFRVFRIRNAALDGANRLASFVIEKADALAAASGVDDVQAVTFADGVVGAFGFASAAVDAFVGNVGSHVAPFKSDGLTANAEPVRNLVSVLREWRSVNPG
jgi:hypothetical protein